MSEEITIEDKKQYIIDHFTKAEEDENIEIPYECDNLDINVNDEVELCYDAIKESEELDADDIRQRMSDRNKSGEGIDKIDLICGLVSLFFGIFGDMFSRAFLKGGSLDIWYITFLFPVFPLSLITMTLYFLGVIKDRKGEGVTDSFVWWLIILPIVFEILQVFLLGGQDCDRQLLGMIIKNPNQSATMFMYIILFFIARISRKSKRCNSTTDISYAMFETILSLIICIILYIVLNLLTRITKPFLPIFIGWEILACVPKLRISLLMSLMHLFLNVLDTLTSYEKTLCYREVAMMPFSKNFPFPENKNKDLHLGIFNKKIENWIILLGMVVLCIFIIIAFTLEKSLDSIQEMCPFLNMIRDFFISLLESPMGIAIIVAIIIIIVVTLLVVNADKLDNRRKKIKI